MWVASTIVLTPEPKLTVAVLVVTSVAYDSVSALLPLPTVYTSAVTFAPRIKLSVLFAELDAATVKTPLFVSVIVPLITPVPVALIAVALFAVIAVWVNTPVPVLAKLTVVAVVVLAVLVRPPLPEFVTVNAFAPAVIVAAVIVNRAEPVLVID